MDFRIELLAVQMLCKLNILPGSPVDWTGLLSFSSIQAQEGNLFVHLFKYVGLLHQRQHSQQTSQIATNW